MLTQGYSRRYAITLYCRHLSLLIIRLRHYAMLRHYSCRFFFDILHTPLRDMSSHFAATARHVFFFRHYAMLLLVAAATLLCLRRLIFTMPLSL